MSGQVDIADPRREGPLPLTPVLVTAMATAAAVGVGAAVVFTGGPTVVGIVAAGVAVIGMVLLAGQLAQRHRHSRERNSRVPLPKKWFTRAHPVTRAPSGAHRYGPNSGDPRGGSEAVMPIPAPSSTLGPGPDRPLPAPSPPADESKTVVIPVGGTQAEDVVGAPAESQDGSEPDAPEPFEPTIFQESSTAGRAPWHLPKGFTPPGLSADGLRLGDIDARAASVVGPGHRCQEPAIARQDAYLLRRSADGRHLIVAVADGVSQSRQADLGARLAVSAAARGAAEVLDRGGDTSDIDPVILFKSVAGEMIGTARNQSLAARDVYSILVVAVIPTGPGPDGRRTMWTAQIGDVSVWTLRSGLLTQRTGPDKSGMDKNTLKYVLPDDPAAVRQAQIELRAGDAVAVMTDGFSESLLNIAGVAEFFSRRWAPGPPHPAVFLHDLCYDAPGQSDDRTVVTAWVGDVERDTGRAT